jgi:hypothetical protein
MLARVVTTALLAAASGVAAAFGFVIVYAIANLYLSGHSIKPTWFDTAAGALLFVAAGGAALVTGAIAWRMHRSRGVDRELP